MSGSVLPSWESTDDRFLNGSRSDIDLSMRQMKELHSVKLKEAPVGDADVYPVKDGNPGHHRLVSSDMQPGAYCALHGQVARNAQRTPQQRPKPARDSSMELSDLTTTMGCVTSAPSSNCDKVDEFILDTIPSNPMRSGRVQRSDLKMLLENEATESTCSETKSVSDVSASLQSPVESQGSSQGLFGVDPNMTDSCFMDSLVSRPGEDTSSPSQVEPAYDGSTSSRQDARRAPCYDHSPRQRDTRPPIPPPAPDEHGGCNNSGRSNPSDNNRPKRLDRRPCESQRGFHHSLDGIPPLEAAGDLGLYARRTQDCYNERPRYDPDTWDERVYPDSHRYDDPRLRAPRRDHAERHESLSYRKAYDHNGDGAVSRGSHFQPGHRSVGSCNERSRYDVARRYDDRSHSNEDGRHQGRRHQGPRNAIDDRLGRDELLHYRDYDNVKSRVLPGGRFHRDRSGAESCIISAGSRHRADPTVVSRMREDGISPHSKYRYDMSASHPSRFDMNQPSHYHMDRPQHHDGNSRGSRYHQRQNDRGVYDDERSRPSFYEIDEVAIANFYASTPDGYLQHVPPRCSERRYNAREDPHERHGEELGSRHSRRHEDDDSRRRHHEAPYAGSRHSRRENYCDSDDWHNGSRHERRPELQHGRYNHGFDVEEKVRGYDIRRDSQTPQPDGRIHRRPSREDDNLHQGRRAVHRGDGYDEDLYYAKLQAFGIQQDPISTESARFETATKSHRSVDNKGEIYLDIGCGTHARLRRAKETMDAVARDHFSPVTCFACSTDLFCIADVQFIVCPKCKTISPVELTEADGTGGTASSLHKHSVVRRDVGMGFTYDTLFKMQSDLLRDRGGQ